LLGLVAERTGYPEDMLGLEADLEAELGIDSIKRVEILGAFQKTLPADIGAAMQAAMEGFTRSRTLSAILAQVQALAPAVAAAPTAGAAPATAAAGASVDFKSLLLGLVAERTGYPEDMLGLEADLEAELGIDSIKRVEILGAFQKALPADIGAAMQAAMEGFTRSRTLSAILNEVRALAPGAAAPAVPAVPPPPSAGAEAAQAAPRIPRYVLKPQPAALHGSSVSLSGLALVLGGPDTVKRVLHPALTAAGMTPVDIDSTAPDALRLAIAQARAAHGPVRALLHLHGLHSPAVETLDDWRDQYRRELLSLFHAAQALGGELAQLRVLAATRLGGTFGRDTIGPGSITAGGVVGMLNCLRQEFPESAMRAVDFDSQTDAQIAQLLLAELQTEDAQPEAGYVGAERHGAVTVEQPLVESPFSPNRVPQADWIVLATGGARGITAELLEELVQPGMRLVLVGRSAEPAAEDPASAALEDPQQLRKALIAMLAAAGGKPKPAEVDRALARLLADREIRANLARLRSAGAEVEYAACDVRDECAFGALIDRLYERHGRIDLVLHGAGVIEDRLLADKTAESFERVLATKLDPAFVLSRRLRPESLKAIAFFTSVAGRYGNRGQTDYAAANETLNRLAWDLQRRWPETRVVAINWGPWDAGMASEGVKRAFRERGIEPIPVAAGRRLFREELAFAPRHDVELVAGRGPWGQQPAPADAGTADAVAAELPLLRGTPRLGPGGHMLLDHTFSVASDPYLDDHRMDGKAVLPAAGALEWMAQFAAAAWPGAQVAEIRDLRLFNGIVLDGDEVSVQLRARAATHSEPDAQSVSVEILNPARKLPCYRATVVLRQRLPDAQLLAVTPLDTPQPFSAEEAYSTLLFHGPRFQLVTSIDGVDAAGLDARVLSTMPAEWLAAGRPGSWLFDPGLVDVPPQMALVWGRLQRQMSALPSRFGSVRRYGAEPLPRSLRLALRLRPASQDASVVYDAFYFDQAGRLRLELRDCESTLSAALNRLGGQAGPAVRRAPEVLT
ncbi:MAG: SDR family NAD(P)-dependent oxidoreductase, partial [Pseudomonadota bacterium]